MNTREHISSAACPEGKSGMDMLDIMNTGTHERMSRWALGLLARTSAHDVLDIGCGGGANLVRLSQLLGPEHLIGLDHSETSCRKAEATVKDHGLEDLCEVLQGSVEHLPFASESFDVITAFETVYFWPEIQASFKEVFRVLKPSGVFMIVNETDGRHDDPEDYSHVDDLMKVYSEQDLKDLLQGAGFNMVRSHYNPDTHWICILGIKDMAVSSAA